MLKKIKKIIKNYRKVKYKNILFSKSEIDLRSRAIQVIFKLERERKNKINCDSCEFYSKNLNQNNLIIFYKKFNSNIQLKAKYDLNLYKKKTNKDACFNSYIIFSNFMMKDKRINNLQKLNTILKINDLLILKFKSSKHCNLIKFFKINIDIEKKLLKFYL
jgi:hypothetical protein